MFLPSPTAVRSEPIAPRSAWVGMLCVVFDRRDSDRFRFDDA